MKAVDLSEKAKAVLARFDAVRAEIVLLIAHNVKTSPQGDPLVVDTLLPLEDIERAVIMHVFLRVANLTRAAQDLGISRRTLQHKLSRYGVRVLKVRGRSR